MVIVRISDCVSWLLPPPEDGYEPSSVTGLSCDHVYVMGSFGGRINVARIRLDSLGTGMPPD